MFAVWDMSWWEDHTEFVRLRVNGPAQLLCVIVSFKIYYPFLLRGLNFKFYIFSQPLIDILTVDFVELWTQ